jgi:penicillin V acylase-like amidase (Ntn superfamily)
MNEKESYMFASTVVARALLKRAFNATNTYKPLNTYTEKTSINEPNRRSVVFPVYSDNSLAVFEFAKSLFNEKGFTKSVPKLTFSKNCSYIRVIAYKD